MRDHLTPAWAALGDLELGFTVGETQDEQLLKLRQEGFDFWIDTSMGRFWKMHTIAPVEPADRRRKALVLVLVGATPWLDNVWLPPDYLEELADKVGARMLTFSLNHDRRPLTPTPRTTVAEFVTLRL